MSARQRFDSGAGDVAKSFFWGDEARCSKFNNKAIFTTIEKAGPLR